MHLVKYIVIHRNFLTATKYNDADGVAVFLWGKYIKDYIIIKDEGKVIKLKSAELTEIIKQLKEE